MKKLCLILVLLLSVTMSGCGIAKDSPNSTATKNSTASANTANKVSTAVDQYDLTKATYSVQNIKINYPQLNNLTDTSKQQKINELIKTSVLEVLNDYQDSLSSLSLTMDYEIKYKGADLLSIEYLGLAYVKDAAHPVNVIQTTNIDLKKEKWLAISDVVTVNDSFAEKIKAGKYKPYSSDLDLEAAGALKTVLEGLSSQDLLEGLKQQTAKFYFTKDSLGVSVEAAHAVGDHLEMEIEYKFLEGLIAVKPQVDNSGNATAVSAGSTTTTAAKQANPTSAIAENQAKEVTLDPKAQQQLNTFFSNFAEVSLDPFAKGSISNLALIRFGIYHNWINNHNLFQTKGDKAYISQDGVNSSVNKYFGVDIQKNEAPGFNGSDGWSYDNGYYAIYPASGETLKFIQVSRLVDLSGGYFSADLNLYEASSGFTDVNSPPESWKSKDQSDIPTLMQKFKATIQLVGDNDSKRYILVDYKLVYRTYAVGVNNWIQ
ncbi:MAG: hypothetical protein P4L69_15160 [Desulfosporosinus sp.]|nr:hypothetical protein [Desulfosporosinus sp.]